MSGPTREVSEEKLKAMEDALAFYANESIWEPTQESLPGGKLVTTIVATKDGGDKARKALSLPRK